MHPTNEEFASYASERCSMPSVVFPIVYLYISKVNAKGFSNTRLLKDIKTGLKSKGWDNNLNELIKCTEEYVGDLSSSEFAQRELSPELLSKISWYNITDNYTKDSIFYIVRHIAKNEDNWVMILDAIKNAASDYEWNYNQDLDYWDDEGNWCHDTPKDMSPIYQYIDELKEQYNEKSLKEDGVQTPSANEVPLPQIISSNSIEVVCENDNVSKGRPKAKSFETFIKRDAPSRFIDVLEEILKNQKGQEAALTISACIGHWIDKPANQSVINRFPNVKRTSFNTAMGNPSLFTNEQKERVRKEIMSRIEEMT